MKTFLKTFVAAVFAAMVIGAVLPVTTHAGTGQYWDCSWGYLQVQNWDNGQTMYKIVIYPGQTAPSSVQALYTGSTTAGLVTEAMIGTNNVVSSLIPGSSAPTNGSAVKAALTAFATRPDCAPPTGDTHPTFRGFNVDALVSHASRASIMR